MSLMRLNFLTTFLRNLFLRDTTQVVVGTIFVQVLNFHHPFIPSGFLTLSALQTNRIDMTRKVTIGNILGVFKVQKRDDGKMIGTQPAMH